MKKKNLILLSMFSAATLASCVGTEAKTSEMPVQPFGSSSEASRASSADSGSKASSGDGYGHEGSGNGSGEGTWSGTMTVGVPEPTIDILSEKATSENDPTKTSFTILPSVKAAGTGETLFYRADWGGVENEDFKQTEKGEVSLTFSKTVTAAEYSVSFYVEAYATKDGMKSEVASAGRGWSSSSFSGGTSL
jgi:hypothetical protein